MRECLNPIDKHLKQGQPPIIRSIIYILANFQHIEIPVLVYLKKKIQVSAGAISALQTWTYSTCMMIHFLYLSKYIIFIMMKC